MIFLHILPILFSSILIAAHFYRAGSWLLTLACLFFPLLLMSSNRWAPRLITVFLLGAAVEWLRTMLIFIGQYQEAGIAWTRMAVILTGVSLVTALSCLVFRTARMKRRYRAAS